MESSVAFIRGSLPIRRTIRKSKSNFVPRRPTNQFFFIVRALLATIRNLGGCPCPRCLIPKSRVQNLGSSLDIKQRKTLERKDDSSRQSKITISRSLIYDRGYGVCSNAVENLLKEHDDSSRQSKITISRSLIYDRGYGVRSNAVENLLKEHSLVPTSVHVHHCRIVDRVLTTIFQNAFSERLGCLGFDLFFMLVVDLMHEFELGVWKALFTHLIRILSAAGAGDVLVHELDRRCVLLNNPVLGCLADGELKLQTRSDVRP